MASYNLTNIGGTKTITSTKVAVDYHADFDGYLLYVNIYIPKNPCTNFYAFIRIFTILIYDGS